MSERKRKSSNVEESACTGPSDAHRDPANPAYLARLGDLHATRELLRQDLLFCGDIGLVSNDDFLQSRIEAALLANIRAVEADFDNELREARISLEREDDDGTTYGYMLSELLRVSYQFSNPSIKSGSQVKRQSGRSYDQQKIRDLLCSSQQAKGLHSPAAFLCGGLRNLLEPSEARSVGISRTPTSFKKASHVVARVLGDIFLDDLEHNVFVSSCAYPACHLAYLSGDEDAALELWKSGRQHRAIDILERSLVHLVVYASDTKMLRRILRCDRRAALHMHADLFRLTPIQVAASRDDVSCFSLLWQHDSDNSLKARYGDEILALAATHGSVKVASVILSSSYQAIDLTKALMSAVNAGRTHVSNMLITHLNSTTSIGQAVLEQLLHQAEDRELWDIVDRFKNLLSCRVTASPIAPSTSTYEQVSLQVVDEWNVKRQELCGSPSTMQGSESRIATPMVLGGRPRDSPLCQRLPFADTYLSSYPEHKRDLVMSNTGSATAHTFN